MLFTSLLAFTGAALVAASPYPRSAAINGRSTILNKRYEHKVVLAELQSRQDSSLVVQDSMYMAHGLEGSGSCWEKTDIQVGLAAYGGDNPNAPYMQLPDIPGCIVAYLSLNNATELASMPPRAWLTSPDFTPHDKVIGSLICKEADNQPLFKTDCKRIANVAQEFCPSDCPACEGAAPPTGLIYCTW